MFNPIHKKHILIVLVFITCVICSPINAQDQHTVLLYTFETGSGNTVKDLSEYENNGELMAAEWGDGKFGGGLTLGGNGPRAFVQIEDNESLDLTEGLTVELWLNLNSASTAGGTGVTKEGSYKVGPRSDQKVLLRMRTNTVAWGSAVVISDQTLALNEWIHIAGTYDANSGDGKVYINGELDNEGNIGGDIFTTDDVLWLGRGAGPFLDGRIDEVRISNIARTQKEVQQLMRIGIEGVLSVTPQDKLATTWGQLKSQFKM